MAGLSMGNIDYGTSAGGITELLAAIRLEMITNAQNDLKDTGAVHAALEAGWSGVDRNIYLDNLEKMQKEICAKLDEYYEAIEKQINELYQSWLAFQQSNVQGG